jgi:hypothetical protein
LRLFQPNGRSGYTAIQQGNPNGWTHYDRTTNGGWRIWSDKPGALVTILPPGAPLVVPPSR